MPDRFERYAVPTAVAVGGALGSLARWGIAVWLGNDGFPVGTFVTNLFGCFALGIVLVAGEVIGRRPNAHHRHQPAMVRLWRPFMATGVLGGFTTFSTLVVEVDQRAPALGVLYLLLSLAAGITCYAAGNALARRWVRA